MNYNNLKAQSESIGLGIEKEELLVRLE